MHYLTVSMATPKQPEALKCTACNTVYIYVTMATENQHEAINVHYMETASYGVF